MHPILLKCGPVSIYSYGAMLAMGFALAVFLASRRAVKFGLDKEKIIDLAVVVLVSGIIGARLFYIILNVSYYLKDPLEILALTKGGLVWYGGFIAALLASLWYTRKKGLNFWGCLDLLAPYLALGQAFGRIGCFLNGCCYGKPGQPVQLYASLSLFILFIILRVWQDRRRFTGEIFLGYCMLYPIKRFLIEFLRADNPRIYMGLTLAQVLSVLIFFGSAGFFLYRTNGWKKRSSGSK